MELEERLRAARARAEGAVAPEPERRAEAEEEVLTLTAVDTIFKSCDRNSDGRVSKRELKSTLKANESLLLNLGLRRVKDVHAFMERFDANSDGGIDLDEFRRAMGVDVPPEEPVTPARRTMAAAEAYRSAVETDAPPDTIVQAVTPAVVPRDREFGSCSSTARAAGRSRPRGSLAAGDGGGGEADGAPATMGEEAAPDGAKNYTLWRELVAVRSENDALEQSLSTAHAANERLSLILSGMSERLRALLEALLARGLNTEERVQMFGQIKDLLSFEEQFKQVQPHAPPNAGAPGRAETLPAATAPPPLPPLPSPPLPAEVEGTAGGDGGSPSASGPSRVAEHLAAMKAAIDEAVEARERAEMLAASAARRAEADVADARCQAQEAVDEVLKKAGAEIGRAREREEVACRDAEAAEAELRRERSRWSAERNGHLADMQRLVAELARARTKLDARPITLQAAKAAHPPPPHPQAPAPAPPPAPPPALSPTRQATPRRSPPPTARHHSQLVTAHAQAQRHPTRGAYFSAAAASPGRQSTPGRQAGTQARTSLDGELFDRIVLARHWEYFASRPTVT